MKKEQWMYVDFEQLAIEKCHQLEQILDITMRQAQLLDADKFDLNLMLELTEKRQSCIEEVNRIDSAAEELRTSMKEHAEQAEEHPFMKDMGNRMSELLLKTISQEENNQQRTLEKKLLLQKNLQQQKSMSKNLVQYVDPYGSGSDGHYFDEKK